MNRLDAICADGWALWEQFDEQSERRGFHSFVAADYDVVRTALTTHCCAGLRFLEWGSATGVITIMADVLGCEAYGIELDASLVRTARTLAETHQSRARFVAGSFVPTGFRWPGLEDSDTVGEGESGYLQLGLALSDFDIVFGYPWGGDAPLMREIMRQYGRPDALLLLNDTNAGVSAERGGVPVR